MQSTIINTYGQILLYDIRTFTRQAHAWITSLLFFLMISAIFPIIFAQEPKILQKIAPAALWTAVLLAILLSISDIFKRDADNGHLDLILLSSRSLIVLVLCKIFAHWLAYAVPLILIAPILAWTMNMPALQLGPLMITLLLGTPTLSLMGAIGAALLIGIRNNGLLLPILIMPLYLPVLIFGMGTVTVSNNSLSNTGHYAIMAALLLLSLALAPIFTSMALRIGVKQ